jgi:hypothetical protein
MIQGSAMALHHLIYIVVNLSNKRCLKKSNQIKSNQIKSNLVSLYLWKPRI